jgi:hypothetical protein
MGAYTWHSADDDQGNGRLDRSFPVMSTSRAAVRYVHERSVITSPSGRHPPALSDRSRSCTTKDNGGLSHGTSEVRLLVAALVFACGMARSAAAVPKDVTASIPAIGQSDTGAGTFAVETYA